MRAVLLFCFLLLCFVSVIDGKKQRKKSAMYVNSRRVGWYALDFDDLHVELEVTPQDEKAKHFKIIGKDNYYSESDHTWEPVEDIVEEDESSDMKTKTSKLDLLNTMLMTLRTMKRNTETILRKIEITGPSYDNLVLSSLTITQIDPAAFENVTNIKSLDLSDNDLTDLPANVFSQLKSLEHLKLSRNKFMLILRNAFVGLDNLKTLDLGDTKFLVKLDNGMFEGLPNNVTINLKGSKQAIITPYGFNEDANLRKPNVELQCTTVEAQDVEEEYNNRVFKPSSMPPKEYDGIVKSAKRFNRLVMCSTNGTVEKVYMGRKMHGKDPTFPVDKRKKKGKDKFQESLPMITKLIRDASKLIIPGGKIQRWARTLRQPRGWGDLLSGIDDDDFEDSSDEDFKELDQVLEGMTEESSTEVPEQDQGNGCLPIYISVNNEILMDKRVLNGFGKDWYQIEKNNFFKILKLSKNNITEVTEEILNDLPREIQTVYLDKNKIKEIRNNVLRNNYIADLSFENNEIEFIEDEAFKYLPNLQDLNLKENNLRSIKFTTSIGPNLRRLNFESNKIVELNGDYFSTVPNLEYLKLEDNKLTKLSANSFSPLKYLKVLNLVDNKINSIDKDAFNGVRCIEALDLSENKLMGINNTIFDNLYNLRNLQLKDNKIDNIEPGSFKNLNRLAVLALDENKIEKLARGAFYGLTRKSPIILFNSCFISLKDNRLKEISSGLFQE